jgi:hypothetical protein
MEPPGTFLMLFRRSPAPCLLRAVRARLPRPHSLALVVLGSSAAALSGCSPKIGDHCVLNTDCGSSGTLVCDTSLPNGYCTQFNCTPDVCQNKAACVALEPAVPGCPYDDYHAPARTNRTICLAQCQSDSDCRQSDGYVCADPRQPPWSVAILDDVQTQHVCVPAVSSGGAVRSVSDAALPEGSVCSASGPELDASFASFTAPEVGADGAADDAGDASPEASESGDAGDAGAGDAAADAGLDAPQDASGGGGDGPGDGASDASSDAGASDAPDGG